ncbi:sulfatase-like hydrolase/transferase [Pontiellaceae bacterium B12227]|nr:sulfatase-like hydrolase/transferase [Pontiellaceae bacterium B12227]
MKKKNPIKRVLSCGIVILLMVMTVSAAAERPNILYIFSDDHSPRTVSAYPGSYPYANTPNIDKLAEHGVSFENAYVGARCVPSRASMLTGRLQINVEKEETRYWPQDFRADGYTTAMIGKWHWGAGAEAHQHGTAWDWSIVWDHGAPDAGGYYYDQFVMIDGAEQTPLGGYSTDRYTDYTLQFLEEQEGATKPWFMWLCFGAVHGPYTPADRHVGALTNAEQTPVPADIYGPRPGKPDYINTFTRWTDQNGVPYKGTQPFDLAVKQYTEAVAAIDEGVGRIFAALEASGQLENTIIIFSADQGYAWGNHGLVDKRFPYEAALRSPLIFYAPDRFATNSWCNHPVNGPDIVRTIHTLAEVDPVIPMDGRDFSQLLVQPEHDESWSDAPMVQIFTENAYGSEVIEQRLADEDWDGLDWNQNSPEGTPYWIMTHDGRYKYTRYMAENHMEELYDLQTDPEELTNLAFNAEFSAKLLELRAQTIDGFHAIGADFVDLLPEPGPLPEPLPSLPPKAAYNLLEDFESRSLGAAISGQGDWEGDSSSATEFVVSQEPNDPSNQVLFFNQGTDADVSLNASALRITNDTTSTLFFRMRGMPVELGGSNLLVRTALMEDASDSDTESASGAAEIAVDFESLSVATEADLSAATIGGSWTLNLDRGAVYSIQADNGGANDQAFLADDSSGGNAGELLFATLTFDTPVDVVSAPDRSCSMTFETGTSRKNVGKNLMYVFHDGSSAEAIRIIWQNDGSLVVNGTTVGTVSTLTDAQMTSGNWDSTSDKVQNVHILFGQTGWDLDWNGSAFTGLSYATGFDGVITAFNLYSEGAADNSKGAYLNDILIIGNRRIVASEDPKVVMDLASDGSSNMTFIGDTILDEAKWYDVWCVVDNADDTFSAYIRPDGSNQFLIAVNKEFRNGMATNDLVSLMLKSPGDSGSSGDAWFDDFYIFHGLDAHHIDPVALPSAQLSPAADAAVHDGDPVSGNFGNAQILAAKTGVAGYNHHAYLKFDVSGISGNVSRALLRLKVQSINKLSTRHQIHWVEDDTWTETELVWNNKPEPGAPLDSKLFSNAGEWVEFDITSQLETERTGDGLLSLLIMDTDGSGCSAYHSKEAASSNDRPLIEIYPEVVEEVNPITLRALWAGSWGQDIGALTHDFDGDGVNNLYEYGWGGNPTNPQVKGLLPTFGWSGTNLVYVYAKRTNDTSLIYYLETTDDLVDGIWSNAGYQVVSTSSGDGELGYVTNRVSQDPPQLFVRPVIK